MAGYFGTASEIKPFSSTDQMRILWCFVSYMSTDLISLFS